MTLPDLLILALATLYWAHAISQTHGAFGIFERMRGTKEKPTLGGLLQCPVCLSFWIGIAFWLLMLTPLRPIVEMSAAAGAATLLGWYVGLWS